MEAPKEMFFEHRCINPDGYVYGTAYENPNASFLATKYIRADKAVDRDALMEYLDYMLCHLNEDGDLFAVARHTIQTITHKINEL